VDREFWLNRWHLGEIGFHEDGVNPYLERFWPRTGWSKGVSVFVPLCGKSRDMIWLAAHGHPVIGVEFSAKAVADFFQENHLEAEPVGSGSHAIWRSENVTLYCGDFFELSAESLVSIQGVYDRAALIALPEALRLKYVQHLHKILPSSAVILLVVLEYPVEQMTGPPFAVFEQEIHALYGECYQITMLHELEVIERMTHLKARGISSLVEKVYLLQPR